MLKSSRTLSTIAALVAVAAVALAQQAAQPPERRAPRDPAATPRAEATTERSGQTNPTERFVINCLLNKNQGEVALSRIAQQQSQNEQVKEFAEMMIKDHSQMVSKLEQLNGGPPARRGAATEQDPSATTTPRERNGAATAPRTEGAERPAAGQREPRRPEGATRSATAGSNPIDTLIQIDNEIAQRCLATARRELESKEGAEFDMAYMAMQVMAHMKMVDELAVLKNHTSSELKQVISQGGETAQEHLAHAKKIKMNLKGEGRATARRETETERPQQ